MATQESAKHDAGHDLQQAVFDNSTKSSTLNARHRKLPLFHIPSGFVGVALTFEVTPRLIIDSTGTDVSVYQVATDGEGNDISITVVASKSTGVGDGPKSLVVASFGFYRLVSGSTEGAASPLTVDVEFNR